MTQGYGTFGWIIEGASEIARGRSEAEGPPELMQSFRAERYGMLAVLHNFTEGLTSRVILN